MSSDKYRNKYRIPSTRLKNFDYSSNGIYSITICTKNRECHFGDVVDSKMELSEPGQIVLSLLDEISRKFPFARLDNTIIMPDHVHIIMIIDKNLKQNDCNETIGGRDPINRVSKMDPAITNNNIDPKYVNITNETVRKPGGITGHHNPMLNKQSLSFIFRWFKGRVSFEINKKFPNVNFDWQTRFYDRIIRNNAELKRIRKYITENPKNWKNDKNNDDFLHEND